MAKKEIRTYSDSIGRLEEILENIDRADLGVDELAEQILEASALLKNCKGILKKTESQIQETLKSLEEDFEDAD